MADPRFDVRMSAYERSQQAKAQQEALQAMRDFHYREMMMNAYTPPKPKTNPIGIPLIKQSGRYYD